MTSSTSKSTPVTLSATFTNSEMDKCLKEFFDFYFPNYTKKTRQNIHDFIRFEIDKLLKEGLEFDYIYKLIFNPFYNTLTLQYSVDGNFKKLSERWHIHELSKLHLRS